MRVTLQPVRSHASPTYDKIKAYRLHRGKCPFALHAQSDSYASPQATSSPEAIAVKEAWRIWFFSPHGNLKGSSPSVTVKDGRELWIYYPNFKSAER
jgi:hypothetical protein